MRVVLLLGLCLFVAGCGDDAKPQARPQAPDVSKGEQVVRAWTDAVRTGDYDKANELFATPATVFNGPPGKATLKTEGAVNAFNRSFPCGAKVEAVQDQGGRRLLATVVLVAASGGRTCPGAVGAKAKVSFLIDGEGHIKEWLRVSTEPPPNSQSA